MKPKIIFSLIAILGISFGIFLFFKSSQQDNIAYGFVDIDTSSLTFLRSGQISDIYVQSGQEVKKGTILAKLNSDDLLIQKRQQIATCQALQASLQEMKTGYTQEQIDKSCYNYKALSNSYELATITLKRLEKLYKAKQISNQEYDEAVLNQAMSYNQLLAAKASCNEMQKGYRAEQIDVAKYKYEQCLAQIDYLDYQLQEQSIISAPFDGFVRSKNKNVGDMANIQDTVLELSDTASKKIIAYFSESQLALIDKDTNFIIVNQAQDHFEAKISYISNTAIFTPKNVITNELRGFLVYEVHLLLTTANNNLRDGQSVSVYFDE